MTEPVYSEDLFANVSGPVAVVMNGSITGNHGSFIDEHDTVVRMNTFRVAGFEPLVGTKFTHWAVNTSPLLRPQPDIAYPFSPFVADAYESRNALGFTEKYGRKCLFARVDYKRLIRYNEITNPTTGYVLLIFLSQLGHQINLFGFDGLKSGHYFNERKWHSRKHVPAAPYEFADISNNYENIKIHT